MESVSMQKIDLTALHVRMKGIPHMSTEQAERMSHFIAENSIYNVLELGFFHGVSSCYIAYTLKGLHRDGAHVTAVDLESARDLNPNIEQLAEEFDLEKLLSVVYEAKSYTWTLMEMIEQGRHGTFDFCYIDGAHNWDTDGFAFFLVDKLLKKGGWIVFDDLDWTYNESPALKNADFVKEMPKAEKETKQVRKVFELLVQQHPSYDFFKEDSGWAFAQKVSEDNVVNVTIKSKTVVVEKHVGIGAFLEKIVKKMSNKLFKNEMI
jgi:predicted O-methyltransferase YrrM